MIDKMDGTIPIVLFTTTILLILPIGNFINFVDAATLNCPSSIGGYSLYDVENNQWDSNNSMNCWYQTSSNDYGNVSVQWKSFVSNPNLYTGSGTWCSGNTVISDHFSSTHYLKVSFDPRESAFSNAGKSLLKHAESMNNAVPCKTEIQTQADSTGTTLQEPNNQSVPRNEYTASDKFFILLSLFIIFVLPIIILVLIIKKIRGRRKRKREKAKQIEEEEKAKEKLTTKPKKKVSIKGGYALNPLTGNYGVTKAQLRSNESNPRVGDYGKDVRKNEDGSPKWHSGLDLQAKVGTPVFSADGGTVIEAGEMGDDRGIVVTIDHGEGWKTHYWHLKEELVKVGQKVDPGQLQVTQKA